MSVEGLQAAERGVIGAVLKDERVLEDFAAVVRSEDFYDTRLGQVWDGLLRMRAASQPISWLTMGAHWAEWGIRGLSFEETGAWSDLVPLADHGWPLAQQVRNASMVRAAGVVGSRLQAADAAAPADLIQRSITELQAIQDDRIAEGLRSWKVSELMALETKPDWLIPGLLERQERFMLTGEEGGGKSWFMQQMALCAAAGVKPFEPWIQTNPVKVMVFDTENTTKQWGRRVKQLAPAFADQSALDAHLDIVPMKRVDVTSPADLSRIHRALDRFQPGLVVIGPLYRLVPRAITTDDEASPLLASLDTIRDRGMALLIEAHAGKSTDGAGSRNLAPRGSSALLGWPEFGYGLRRHDGGAQLVRWRGDREERSWPKHLRWNLAPGQLPWEMKLG